MWGWNERPTKAQVAHHVGGDAPAVVYRIGQYEVTVPGAEALSVTYRVPHYRTTDPRNTLPNMEIADGEIRIPVDDLVGAALARLEPREIARALWRDDAVKSEFIECLSERYSMEHHALGDNDRRAVLAKLKETVHEVALDRLANVMAKAEFEISRRAHFYDEVRRINDKLRELDVRVERGVWKDGKRVGAEMVVLQFDERDRGHDSDLAIGGRAWNEARDFWRGEVLKQFPGPEEPAAEPAEAVP